ncbi:hypothetical protein ABZX40_15585 [Streptomyces sp. NPDC004610]|uniref:hypothetical protein n=1 Tax=unclassified Streptomyces TaxID=2593676 RepID=UPI0033B58962
MNETDDTDENAGSAEKAASTGTGTGSAENAFGVNPGYGYAQLAAALRTAHTHPDAATRHRAEEKGRAWRSVLAGMANGRLLIGSRTPVTGLPAWVTPEVLRGGFASGTPSAGGPLQPYEAQAAARAGVPAERGALFTYFLTEAGLTDLGALLDSGRYEVAVPEEAALLTVAWLARAGRTDAALDLVAELAPFAERLRFTPRPVQRAAPDPRAVHRSTAGEAARSLAGRRPSTAVDTQREAVTVWAPFADELLAHWLESAEDGEVPARQPDADWRRRAALLLARYRELADRHTLCAKHRRRGENLWILRTALEKAAEGRRVPPRELGLLRATVAAMVRRRGEPGSPRHTALRQEQAAQAALPSHHDLAALLVERLSALPAEAGVADPEALLTPVTDREAAATGLPPAAPIPAPLRRPVESALSAPLETLVERGVVPSAEALAELVPQLVAATTAQAYPDPALRALSAATYRAFRNRRSLLLLNLERQVRVAELPWVGAVAPERAERSGGGPGSSPDTDIPATALRRLAGLAVGAFPGTLLPNPLIRELSVLAREADLGAPLTEELAADIFMGAFSPKFMVAARIAAEQLRGTLYERYYAIDYRALRNTAIEEAATTRVLRRATTSPAFADLCRARAEETRGGTLGNLHGERPPRSRSRSHSRSGSWSVADNGKIIEQAQILTTHNLAVLTARAGATPPDGWPDLAHRAFLRACRLASRLPGNPRPLPTIKDTAYAWRQMIYFLSLSTPAEQTETMDRLWETSARSSPHLTPALIGLHQTLNDGTPDGGGGRSLVGWSTNGHWLGRAWHPHSRS